MTRTRSNWTSVGAILILACPALAASEPELLAEVKSGFLMSVESMRTLHFRASYTRTKVGSTKGQVSGCEYWQQGEKVKIRWDRKGARSEHYFEGAKKTVLHSVPATQRNSQHQFYGAVSPRQGGALGTPPVLGDTLLATMAPGWAPYLRVDHLLNDQAMSLESVQKEQVDGRDLVLVELSNTEGRLLLWFDPAANYLVRKRYRELFVYKNGKPGHSVGEVTDFAEVTPAIFFPQRTIQRFYADGELTSTEEVTFTDITINEPFPPDVLSFDLPPNTMYDDHITKKRYIVDASGIMNELKQELPAISYPPPIEPEPSHEHKETAVEPTPLTYWILPASLAALVVGLGLALFRMYRRGVSNR